MTKNPRLLIHVGLPKTGTTVLQKDIFPFCSARYLGTNGNALGPGDLRKIRHPSNSAHALCKSIVGGDLFPSANSLKALSTILHEKQVQDFTEFEEYFRRYIQGVGHKINGVAAVYSDETLCTPPSEKAVIDPASPFWFDARAIKRVFADYDPITVCYLRAPVPFLKSRYINFMLYRLRLGLSPLTFEDYIAECVRIGERFGYEFTAIGMCLQKSFVSRLEIDVVRSYEQHLLPDMQGEIQQTFGVQIDQPEGREGVPVRNTTAENQAPAFEFLNSAMTIGQDEFNQMLSPQNISATLQRHDLWTQIEDQRWEF